MKYVITLIVYFCMLNTLKAAPSSTTKGSSSIYDGCYTEKSCFGVPSGCVETKNCVAITTVLVDDNNRYIFEMESDNAAWVGVGLSDDNLMGDDSVIECAKDNDGPHAYMSWTIGRPNFGAYRVPEVQDEIELLEGSVDDGKLYCKVKRNTVTTVNNQKFDLENDSYYLLVASGSNIGGYHDITNGASPSKAKVSSVTAYEN